MTCERKRPAPASIAGNHPDVTRLGLPPRGLEMTLPYFDELLGTLAHELRNPLATVLGVVQMITCDCDVDSAARRALAVLERQAQQAMRLIDDVFDICAGAQGKLSLCKESVGL